MSGGESSVAPGVPAGDAPVLAGRTALVTGAGRGIGRAIGIALARAGASVTLVARTHADLQDVAAEIRANGGAASPIVLDVTDESAVRAAIRELPTHDILVNAAGTNRPEPIREVDIRTLDALMAVNVRATFIVTQAVVSRLLDESRTGVVINISSQMGHVGAANRSVYCMTKHAVEGLTKALGVELAPHGIRVVSIAPTFIDTPLTRPFFADPQFRADVLASIPLGRLGQPEEVAAAAVFLASPQAALITGSSLLLDGGWTAR